MAHAAALSPQARTLDKLKIGDHVYAPRDWESQKKANTAYKEWILENVAGAALGKENLYCHHGIVVEVKDKDGKDVKKVIGFIKKNKNKTEGATENAIASFCIEAVADWFKDEEGTIALQDLDEFKNPRKDKLKEGEEHYYLLYQYGVSEDQREKANYLVGSSTATSASDDGHRAAEIAELFRVKALRTSGVFGKYNLADWNCECFASFCKTTRRDISTIKEELDNIPNGPGSFVSRDFLEKESKTATFQVKCLEKNGILQVRAERRAEVFKYANLDFGQFGEPGDTGDSIVHVINY